MVGRGAGVLFIVLGVSVLATSWAAIMRDDRLDEATRRLLLIASLIIQPLVIGYWIWRLVGPGRRVT
jgi:hypothetical protein